MRRREPFVLAFPQVPGQPVPGGAWPTKLFSSDKLADRRKGSSERSRTGSREMFKNLLKDATTNWTSMAICMAELSKYLQNQRL